MTLDIKWNITLHCIFYLPIGHWMKIYDCPDWNFTCPRLPDTGFFLPLYGKGRHKRESKTLNKCETRNKTVFHTRLRHPETTNSVPLNSVFFANQTNRCLAGFAFRSDLFRDNARLTKHRRKVNQRHLILQAMYTTMWLEIDCWLAVSHIFRWKLDSRIKQCFFFCFRVTQTRNRKCAKPFCFLMLVSCFLTLVCGGPKA